MRSITSPLEGISSPLGVRALAPTLALDLLAAPLDPRITFTRASAATFVGSNGLIQSAAANVPRFDYDPVTLLPRGLMIEEQRTNRTLNSEDFTGAAWAATVSGTSTRVNDGAPLGFTRGLITATSAGGGIRQTLSGLTSGQVYALSFYIQSTSTSVQILFENGTAGFGATHNVIINPSNGTAAIQAGFTSVRVEPFGPGFIYTLITAPAGGLLIANVEWRITNSGESIRLGRPQFEAGAFATSYIPTAASQVTRTGDLPAITGQNFAQWYRQDEGTFFFEGVQRAITGAASRGVSANDGTINESIQLAISSNGGEGYAEVRDGGVAVVTSVNGAVSTGAPFKMAFAYRLNDCALSVNGGAVTTDTSATMPTPDRLSIGTHASGTSPLNGHIRRLTYYPTRLPNSTLQALTA